MTKSLKNFGDQGELNMGNLPEIARQKTGFIDELYLQARESFPEFSGRMETVLKNFKELDPVAFADTSIKIAEIKLRQKAQDNVVNKFDGDACLSCVC